MTNPVLDTEGLALYDKLLKAVAGGSLVFQDGKIILKAVDGTVLGETRVVRSVNNIEADPSGNVAITSVDSATKATKDADGNTISSTYLKTATASSTYLTKTDASSTYLGKSGSRGALAGYNTPGTADRIVTIDASSNDDTVITQAITVTVNNGSSDQTWTKTVMIQSLYSSTSSVSLGSSWAWVGGDVPALSEPSVLVLKWCGSYGIANLIAGG